MIILPRLPTQKSMREIVGIQNEYSRPRGTQTTTTRLLRCLTTIWRNANSRGRWKREYFSQRAHHSFMRRDEDLTLRKKKSVELRSGKEKPEETTESRSLGLRSSTGKPVAGDSNESDFIGEPVTGWRSYTSPTNSSSSASWWQSTDWQSSWRSWTEYWAWYRHFFKVLRLQALAIPCNRRKV